MIIDGRNIAEEIIAKLLAKRSSFQSEIRLGVVLGAEDAASASFVRIKEQVADRLRVTLVREVVSAETTTEVAAHTVQWVFKDMQGIIVQLPLPSHLDTEKILAAIPPKLDVDGINPTVRDIDRLVRPPVAEALAEILSRTGALLRGQQAVVVGAGRLVGQPCASLLRQMGAHVTVVTQEEGSIAALKTADVMVLGAGTPSFVKPEMLKEGVILFDAGTSASPMDGLRPREAGGKVVGDADPSCAAVASVFTPVPGGVGPIAVAMLFKNLFALLEK